MSGLRGFVGGLLGLTLLDAALSAATANSWLGQVPVFGAEVFDYWLARNVPLIPNWHCQASKDGGMFNGSVGGLLGGLQDIGLGPVGSSILGAVGLSATTQTTPSPTLA